MFAMSDSNKLEAYRFLQALVAKYPEDGVHMLQDIIVD